LSYREPLRPAIVVALLGAGITECGPLRWRMAQLELRMDPPATRALRKAGFGSALDRRLNFDGAMGGVAGNAPRNAGGVFTIAVPGDLTQGRDIPGVLQAYASAVGHPQFRNVLVNFEV